MANQEKMEQLSKLIQEGKQKLSEAAQFAADNGIKVNLNLFGTELYLENLDNELKGYDLTEEGELSYYEARKRELEDMFGKTEGYVWASSSSFC